MKQSSISWLVIATVSIAYLAGLLAAVGHHLFYQSLAGTLAPDTSDQYKVLNFHVTRQELNIVGGTALAFLVKSALSTAISTAYVQLLWKTLMHSTQRTTLSMVDTTFSASTLSLIKVWTWWRYPLLFGLAAITALLPLASIVTPATLTIVQKQITPAPTNQTHVPNVDFASLNYVQDMSPSGAQMFQQVTDSPPEYLYNGPSTTVSEIVQAGAVQGSVAPINPPARNTSWTVGFNGPALTCKSISKQQSTAIQSNIIAANLNGAIEDCRAYGYIAWVATGDNGSATLPFKSTGNNTYALPSYNGLTYDNPAIFYMAAMPNMMQVINYGEYPLIKFCEYFTNGVRPDLADVGKDSTFTQCEMVNASYSVSFDYRNGSQAVEINTTTINADQPLLPIKSVFGPSQWVITDDGAGWDGIPSWNGIASVDWSKADPLPSIDSTLLRTLSYQAIMDAFLDQITGTVSLSFEAPQPDYNTSILTTTLTRSPELSFLFRPLRGSGTKKSMQDAAAASNDTTLHSLLKNVTVRSNTSLAAMTEDLFKNIVVSMMSSPQLQPNYSSPFAPEKVVVTTYAEQNFYVYSAWRLWIAYGLAIAFTTFAVGTGIFAILENEGTYTNDFSTVLRIVHSGKLVVDLDDKDTDARGPLSDKLANATVTLAKPDGMASRVTSTDPAKDGSTIMLLDYAHNEGIAHRNTC
ncbi:hypothetical protein MBLNU457_2124t1 [Dothideomycetes sp. NU457]